MSRTKAAKADAPAEDFEPDAFVIRSCGKDGGSHNGFLWPLDVGAIATCPDWKPTAECGNGLHGLLDGVGDWSLIDDGPDRLWQVVGVLRSEVVAIDDAKVKYPRAKIVYTGTAAGALTIIRPKMVEATLRMAEGNTATGDSGHAAATGAAPEALKIALLSCLHEELWLLLRRLGDPETVKPDVAYSLSDAGEFVEAT